MDSTRVDIASLCDGILLKTLLTECQTIGVPLEYMLYSTLTTTASFMAPSSIRLGPRWQEPVVLWAGIYAYRGARRTTTLNYTTQLVQQTENCDHIVTDINLADIQGKLKSKQNKLILTEDWSNIKLESRHEISQMAMEYDSIVKHPTNVFCFVPPPSLNALKSDENSDFLCKLLLCKSIYHEFTSQDILDASTNGIHGSEQLSKMFCIINKLHGTAPRIYSFSNEAQKVFDALTRTYTGFRAKEPIGSILWRFLAKAPAQIGRVSAILGCIRNALKQVLQGAPKSESKEMFIIELDDVEMAATLVRHSIYEAKGEFFQAQDIMSDHAVSSPVPSRKRAYNMTTSTKQDDESTIARINQHLQYYQALVKAGIETMPTAFKHVSLTQKTEPQDSPIQLTTTRVQTPPAGVEEIKSKSPRRESKSPSNTPADLSLTPSPESNSTAQNIHNTNLQPPLGTVKMEIDTSFPNTYCGKNSPATEETEDGPDIFDWVGDLSQIPNDGPLEHLDSSDCYFVYAYSHNIVRTLEFNRTHELSASLCAQRHFSPPLSRGEVERQGSTNRFPVTVAKSFLKRLAKLGFGETGYKSSRFNTRRPMYFTKTPYDELTEQTKGLLAYLDIDRNRYDACFLNMEEADESGPNKKLKEDESCVTKEYNGVVHVEDTFTETPGGPTSLNNAELAVGGTYEVENVTKGAPLEQNHTK